jgi:hypothetical protein
MALQFRKATRLRLAALFCFSPLLGGCTHDGFGSNELHFATFSVPPPKNATVHVCHAYGCRVRSKFTFTAQDLSDVGALMAKTKNGIDTPEEERRAIAYAIGWIETRVGAAIGTSADRAGMDFEGSGDPAQQDCVDEATNTTSYLTVLASHNLIRHHTVGVPFAKDNYLRGVAGWTHWTAVLVEKAYVPDEVTAHQKGGSKRKLVHKAVATPTPQQTLSNPGQRWAVDSWIYANGENPAIVVAEDWYISDLDSLPKSKK